MKRTFALVLCCAIMITCLLTGCSFKKADNESALICEPVSLLEGENKFEVKIGNDTFKQEIETTLGAVTLSLGEINVAVTDVKLTDSATIEVTFEIADVDLSVASQIGGMIVVIDKAVTNGGKTLSGFAPIMLPTVTSSSVIAGASAFDVTLKLSNAVFANISDGDFTLLDAFEDMSIENVSKSNDTEVVLSLNGDMKLSDDGGYPYTFGEIIVKASGTSAVVDTAARVPFVFAATYWNCNEIHDEEGEQGALKLFDDVEVDGKTTVILALESCEFKSGITKGNFTLSGVEEISIKDVKRLDETNVALEFNNDTDKELHLFDGIVVIDADATTAAQKLYATLTTLDDIHKVVPEPILLPSDPLTYEIFGFNYDYTDILRVSLNSIVSKGASKLLDVGINAIFGTDTDSKKLDELLDNMKDINNKIAQLDADVKHLIEEIEAESFKQQMRDVQAVVDRLTANVAGYQGGAKALNKFKPGTEIYNDELEFYANSINVNGTFHQDTYVLGAKLLSDAGSSSSGAIKAHMDYLLKTSNWERATYKPRQEFFVYTIGTYYQAVAYDLIGLKYITETSSSAVEIGSANAKIDQISNQIDEVNKMLDATEIRYLKDEYNVSMKTGIIIRNTIEEYKYHRNNSFIDFSKIGYMDGEMEFSCPETNLLSRAQAAELLNFARGNTLLQDMEQGGCILEYCNGDPIMTCDYSIYQDVSIIPGMYGPTQYIITNLTGYYYVCTDRLEKKEAPTGLFSTGFYAAIPQYVGRKSETNTYSYIYME